MQLLVVVLLLLAHAHSSAADFAGYPYCTTSPTGTCQPCEVSSSGSSDVPCTVSSYRGQTGNRDADGHERVLNGVHGRERD